LGYTRPKPDRKDEHRCTQGKRQAIHLRAGERWARARDSIGNGGGVLREGIEDSTGVVEVLDGLVTGVGDRRCDPQPIDNDVGSRGQVLRARLGVAETGTAEAARTTNEGRRGEKSIVVKSGSGWRGDYTETLPLNELG